MPDDSEEFYVGYEPQAPPHQARFLSRLVLLLLLGCAGVAIAATLGHGPGGPGTFEYGEVRSFEGWIELEPHPQLVVERPSSAERSRYLLTVFGKFGAREAVAAHAGQRVSLEGQLIWRDDRVMIEVDPASLTTLSEQGAPPMALTEDLGAVTLRGEIVDSKCYLGVMKPGHGKPHRSCAARCIAGGVPPVLMLRDEEGWATYYLLVGAEGEALGEALLPFVAEPVEVTGQASQLDDLRVLRARLEDIRRL